MSCVPHVLRDPVSVVFVQRAQIKVGTMVGSSSFFILYCAMTESRTPLTQVSLFFLNNKLANQNLTQGGQQCLVLSLVYSTQYTTVSPSP